VAPRCTRTEIIWAVIDVDVEIEADCERGLSKDEQLAAARRVDPRLRARYCAHRAFLRRALARHTGTPDHMIAFEYGPAGKPSLASADTSAGQPRFNLSHAQGIAVLAINNDAAVGVDVEAFDRAAGWEEIADSALTPTEREGLQQLAPERRAAGFLATWTRKEAFLKGLGAGLGIPLNAFAVTTDPDCPPALVSVDFAPHALSQWSLHAVPAPSGFIATLAVRGRGTELVVRDWDWSAGCAGPPRGDLHRA
jgi:4'-phosphopantetheinyl transferase